ncbi:MAG: hypothetical protein AB7H96_12140 [Vicinamibacterales bacterium]
MPEKTRDKERARVEDVDPAPLLGQVGDGATLPSGEYISRELRELTERARAQRREDKEREPREP